MACLRVFLRNLGYFLDFRKWVDLMVGNMKKLIMVCLFSLLTITSVFAGFKATKEAFKKDWKEFVDKKKPKVEADIKKGKESLKKEYKKTKEFVDDESLMKNAYHEIEEYVEAFLNTDGPRVKAAMMDVEEALVRGYKKTKEEIEYAYDEVKEYVEDEICSADKNYGKMIDEESQKRDLLDLVKSDFLKALRCLEKEVVIVVNAALDNGLRHYLRHETWYLMPKIADSCTEVKKHINNFIEKQGSMIEQLEDTDNIRVALKMELSDFEDIELAGELVDYRIFVAACKYIISLEEVSLAYSDEELSISVENFRHRLEVFEKYW